MCRFFGLATAPAVGVIGRPAPRAPPARTPLTTNPLYRTARDVRQLTLTPVFAKSSASLVGDTTISLVGDTTIPRTLRPTPPPNLPKHMLTRLTPRAPHRVLLVARDHAAQTTASQAPPSPLRRSFITVNYKRARQALLFPPSRAPTDPTLPARTSPTCSSLAGKARR